jgi:hypothetical protein
MTTFEIEVTQNDIEQGEEGVFDCCPIGLCLHRLGCEKVDVDEDRILLTYNSNRYVYKTPRAANLFIDDFDSGRKVAPIQFKLEKPQLATIKDERLPLYSKSTEEED